jgi:signal transduction histidine kinase
VNETRPRWWRDVRQRPWQARYALAALLLLLGLVTGLGILGAWLEARNVRQVSEGLALALTDGLETSGRNALLANQRLEEAIAQRLLDNARLLDWLLIQVPLSNQLLAELAARNGPDRIEVLDARGTVLATSAIWMPALVQEHLARHGMDMHGMPPMLRHWYEPLLRGQAQQALQGFGEQRFWLGRQYAVAIRRQKGSGIIAISADAEEILRFRQEVGLQRLLNDVAVDPQQLKQALINLLLNAIQATPPGGSVRVTLAAEPEALRIAVIDSGSGITPEMMDRIFDPYFTTKAGGTGLGLPIALRIIQAHGGTLDVSNAFGRGTTVAVRLPIARPGLEATRAQATS